MPVQVSFPRDGRTVMPGEQIVLRATVQNPGADTEAYTVVPWGLNGAWLVVEEPSITLFGGTSRVIDVIVRPPRVWSTTAGRYEVEIRVVPHRDPLAAMSAVAVVDVDGFEEVDVAVIPREKNLHRRARFEIDVTNRGNHLADCRVRFVAGSGELSGLLDRSVLALSAGSHGIVRLTVRADDAWLRRDRAEVDFDVEVEVLGHDDGVEVVKASATATLLPTFSADRLRDRASRSVAVRIAAIALVTAALWWLVVEPWIGRRVDDAAERRVQSSSDSLVAGDHSTDGEPFAIALSAQVDPDRTGIDSYRNESGSSLWIDELVIQNPEGDDGTAVLTVGDKIVRNWELSSMTATAQLEPLQPPVGVGAGEAIALSVDCARPGGTNRRCETALVVIVRRRSP